MIAFANRVVCRQRGYVGKSMVAELQSHFKANKSCESLKNQKTLTAFSTLWFESGQAIVLLAHSSRGFILGKV